MAENFKDYTEDSVVNVPLTSFRSQANSPRAVDVTHSTGEANQMMLFSIQNIPADWHVTSKGPPPLVLCSVLPVGERKY